MWKKSGVWGNRKFRLLLLLEAVLLLACVVGLIPGDRLVADGNTMEIVLDGGEYLEEGQGYYIDGSYGYQGAFLTARPGKLWPGVYRLRLVLEAETDVAAEFVAESESGIFRNLLSNPVTIHGGLREQTCQFYVCGMEDSAKFTVNYSGEGALLIRDIELIHTNAGSRILICLLVIGAAAVNVLVMLYCYGKRNPVSFGQKLVWFGIPALAGVASFPLLVDYAIIGYDLTFHLTRIEALAQSLGQWNIPTRLEAMWLCGHGYANSIFYCDTFLTLPAILRLIGFPMHIAYGMYVFTVNFATAGVAYLCFKGCFSDKRIGMLGSMLYTLAPYRIYNIYNRSAVGEYTAMIFLPLLVYGFYRIFTGNEEEKGYKWSWLVTAIGFSGLIQSHVLSCEIAGGFTVLLCLLLIKKVFTRPVFLQLAGTVVGTIVLNLWFLLPFVDMMVSGNYYFSVNYGNEIQNRGTLPAHILYTMQAAGNNPYFHAEGLLDTDPISVGMAVLLGVGAFWIARMVWRDRRDRKQDMTAVIAFGIGVFALFASTIYFPWDAVRSWNKVTGMLVSMLQFPTRLTIISVLCLTFVACVGGKLILNCGDRFLRNTFFVIVCGAALVFSLYQTNDILMKKGGILRLYTAENMGSSSIMGGEYLPEGASADVSYHDAVSPEGVEVLSFAKEGLDTVTQVSTAPGGGEYWLELPMLLYKGYRAQDMDTGEVFEVQAGTNQEVRVILPAGYSGTLHVWYAGMWYWRVAEMVSLAAAIAVALLYVKKKGLN